MTGAQFNIEEATLGRFAADLDRVAPGGSRIGIAVSGGPDSLALLLLASAARPGSIEAATVDHGLRPESASEAERVAGVCERLSVPHSTLKIEWQEKPESAIQERARTERYRLLDRWAAERGLDAVATGHHLDDQAETFLMRLARGAGVRGLAGMRAVSPIPAGQAERQLIRPLLTWRRSQLEELCRIAGVEPVNDPSNTDDRFERIRMRNGLASADWFDPDAIGRSASHLASADAALNWAVEREWESQVSRSGEAIAYTPAAPPEIRRRIVQRSVEALASEGTGHPLRGSELDHLLATLSDGGTATLRGVACTGGVEWTFTPAPPRRH